MAHHIILCAFGTTTQSRITYDYLHNVVAEYFPNSCIHWSYSSPTIRHALKDKAPGGTKSLTVLLDDLHKRTPAEIVVQSLHVLPGQEFHRMVRESGRFSPLPAIGMPLLNSPGDFQKVANLLSSLFPGENEAVLILGHGTRHPSWTAYPALEAVLRVRGDRPVFVTGLEYYPGSDRVIDEIVESGCKRVLVIPFLMVAGMHFNRDIIGDHPEAWKSKLQRRGIDLKLHETGLGLLPGIAEIFCNHIEAAASQEW
jgi:sirohydrochlorin cobaltochelatase